MVNMSSNIKLVYEIIMYIPNLLLTIQKHPNSNPKYTHFCYLVKYGLVSHGVLPLGEVPSIPYPVEPGTIAEVQEQNLDQHVPKQIKS